MGSALADIADGLKRLNGIQKDLSELELREEVVALKELLLSAKENALILAEENEQLRRKLQQEVANREKMRDLIEVEGFKYDCIDRKPVGLPFCPRCEVKEEGKLYRLKRTNPEHSQCPNCDNRFNVGADGNVHQNTQMPRPRRSGMVV